MKVSFALCAAALLAANPARPAELHRFALFIGDAQGGPGTRPLRYAERDARRMHGIFTSLGGVRDADALLLTNADAGQVRSALADLTARVQRAKDASEPTELLVYYSGHAKDGELRLGDTAMPLSELRALLERAPADVRIGLFDSCQSGAITRAKGVRNVPAFEVQKSRVEEATPRGLVLIASSSADEESQESDEIGASFFTHYLATGLLGDADASGDGKVTLAEAYAYAYGRTVGSTAGTAAGAQHPVYLYDLGGAGDVILTELSRARGGLLFGPAQEGVYVVLDASRRAVAEVAKSAGESRRLALAPGRYLVKKRDGDTLLVGEVRVAEAEVPLADAALARRPLEDDPQKGATGPHWALAAGLGGQLFFSGAARTGLFPPAGLAGLEVTARGDLGHALAWGVDLSFGGGVSKLRLDGLAPIPVQFAEISGGASLLRDFEAGPVTLSLGGRLAFIDLTRRFPGHPEYPHQSFFTLTPGVVVGAALPFGERLSAFARARVNYLFYNVDSNQSLGYAELSLGVIYAFGP